MTDITDPGSWDLRRVLELRRLGDRPAALQGLRELLRRHRLTDEEIARAGSLIRESSGHVGVPAPEARVLIAGQCTTSWLVPVLAAVSWKNGHLLEITEAPYDNVLQQLHGMDDQGPIPELVILLPWSHRIVDARLETELVYWQSVWARLRSWKTRWIQVGYDLPGPGAGGFHLGGSKDGMVSLVRRLNEEMRAGVATDAYFVDLELVAGGMGRERFYDRRQYHWTRQPFSPAGLVRLAEHLHAGHRALTRGPRKVLAVDLDDTLWGGVVGEVGPRGIEVAETPAGEAHRALQRFLKDLAARGILLAVCSKNDPHAAREPFLVNEDMVLRLEDLAAFEAGWEPKEAGLRRIAGSLGLGLDSVVFLDDNPAEREHIRRALPEVGVVEVSGDPADLVDDLEKGLWFEALSTTSEDRGRAGMYLAEAERRKNRVTFDTTEDFLRSLAMVGEVRPFSEADIPRILQLVAKTNQFNLTSRRHSAGDLGALVDRPGSLAFSLRLTDRYGDHGLVGVLIAVPASPGELRIDTWLMSCRVIGRTAEHFMFGRLLERCRELDCRRLIGEYCPTASNVLVSGLYPELGFFPVERGLFTLDVSAANAPVTWVSETGGKGIS